MSAEPRDLDRLKRDAIDGVIFHATPRAVLERGGPWVLDHGQGALLYDAGTPGGTRSSRSDALTTGQRRELCRQQAGVPGSASSAAPLTPPYQRPGSRTPCRPTATGASSGLTFPDCALACARTIEQAILGSDPELVSCVIVEPVMGTAGCSVPPPGYLAQVREICDRYGIDDRCPIACGASLLTRQVVVVAPF